LGSVCLFKIGKRSPTKCAIFTDEKLTSSINSKKNWH
jgi:hypothetical protein